MSTITKEKEKIITEPDQVLADFKRDIGQLTQRVKQLEAKQAGTQELIKTNRKLNSHLAYQEKRQDLLAKGQLEEYQVLNKVLTDLKNPVSQVVTNLDQIQSEVHDNKLKKSLQGCLDTAQQVLESFNRGSEYVSKFSAEVSGDYSTIDLRGFLRDLLLQHETPLKSLKLFVDQSIPEEIVVKADLLQNALNVVIPTLISNIHSGDLLSVTAHKKKLPEIDVEVGLDIKISLKSSRATGLKWSGSWQDSVATSGQEKNMIPIDWVSCRNNLRKYHGELLLLEKDGYLIGTEIELPLPYNKPVTDFKRSEQD